MAVTNDSRPMWDRRKVLTPLVAGAVGQTLLVVPGDRCVGSVLLGLTIAHALFFFRNVRLATRLEGILRESGDLPPEGESEEDEGAPMGAAQPWALLVLPVVYVASLFDPNLDVLVTAGVVIDAARLVFQFIVVAVVGADLGHRVRMLTDPAYLQRALDRAREQGGPDAKP